MKQAIRIFMFLFAVDSSLLSETLGRSIIIS